jgi:hypothetical protein
VLITEASTEGHHDMRLAPTVRWLIGNDDQARAIGQAGRQLAREVLTYENILLYWFHLLRRYAELQSFEVHVPPGALPIEQAVLSGAEMKRECKC